MFNLRLDNIPPIYLLLLVFKTNPTLLNLLIKDAASSANLLIYTAPLVTTAPHPFSQYLALTQYAHATSPQPIAILAASFQSRSSSTSTLLRIITNQIREILIAKYESRLISASMPLKMPSREGQPEEPPISAQGKIWKILAILILKAFTESTINFSWNIWQLYQDNIPSEIGSVKILSTQHKDTPIQEWNLRVFPELFLLVTLTTKKLS